MELETEEIISDSESDVSVTVDQMEEFEQSPPDEIEGVGFYHPFFVTVTHGEGRLAREHVIRFANYCEQSAHKPTFWIYVCEGGDGPTDKHLHIHAILWYANLRKTDSITRSVKYATFDRVELREFPSTRNLVRTERCVNLQGALRYVLKDHVGDASVPRRLPTYINYDDVQADLAAYHARSAEHNSANKSVFPEPGKTTHIPPTKVPDLLDRASTELCISIGHTYAFSELIIACFKRGIRFDVNRLGSFKLALAIIQADDTPSEILKSWIEYKSNK